MLRSFRVLTALLLSLIFLVSFTGIRLVVHHCFGCEQRDVWLLVAEHDCCGHAHQKGACCNDDTATACGIGGEAHDDCCNMESFYLKHDYRFAQEKPAPRPAPREQPEFFKHSFTDLTEPGYASVVLPSEFVYEPPGPPYKYGRDFLIFSRQLKFG